METSARTLDRLNKVVVACLDGGRLRGYVLDFSALRDSFNLLPQEDPLKGQGIKVELKDLKAVFFVRDFVGNRERRSSPDLDPSLHGRKIEVIFADGEKITGKTEGYNPQKLGFFIFPGDTHDNNQRIFVVTKNVRLVKLL